MPDTLGGASKICFPWKHVRNPGDTDASPRVHRNSAWRMSSLFTVLRSLVTFEQFVQHYRFMFMLVVIGVAGKRNLPAISGHHAVGIEQGS
jgi:hypothetical protein